MVQPQPHGGSNFQWEMAGEEAVAAGGQGLLMNSSQGSLRVPPELAGNEVVHRLMMDNHQLREALKRSNNALKDRCEEMEGWQQRSKREREFLNSKIHEARALVERLVQENRSLLGKLGHSASYIVAQSSCAETESQPPNQEDFPKFFHQVLGMADQKDGAEQETDRQTMPRSLPSEGSNEFLRLLKSHKEKLEEGMRDLKRRNEELEKKKMESEKENKELLSLVEQLTQRTQMVAVTENAFANANSFTVLPERYRKLQDQLNVLLEKSMQRDIIEVQLKDKEKESIEFAKDNDALRAQVTSLVGELQECQSSLRKSEEEKGRLEEELGCKTDERKKREQEVQQHSVAMDKLLMQKQNLETALKNERLVVIDERRKLAQLQHAYTCLFQDYDNNIKTIKTTQRVEEMENLNKRLEEAEKALALKQSHIDKLKEELEQQRVLQETVEVLTAQADIYKSDFLAERRAREELNQKKEELQEKLNQAQTEINLLKQEKMQQRHMDSYRPHMRLQPPALPGPAVSQPNRDPAEMQPDFVCPKCRYVAPDMDTLQIHVMDCIQ